MTLSGMNVESIIGVGNRLNEQANQLEASLRAVDKVVGIAAQHWKGPNLSQFRAQWDNHYRRTGLAVITDLRQLADLARRNAEQQRRTSSTLDGAGGGSAGGPGGARGLIPLLPAQLPNPIGWLKDGIAWVGHQASDGVAWVTHEAGAAANWVKDTVQDGAGWLNQQIHSGERWVDDRVRDFGSWCDANPWVDAFIPPLVQNEIPALWRFAEALGTVPTQILKDIAAGQPPQLAELGASAVLIAGTAFGIGLNLGAGRDVGFMDPGKPGAGTPVPSDKPQITNFSELTAATMQAYELDANEHIGVRVDTVVGADGVTRYIVNIPGTQGELGGLSGWSNNEASNNWSANLWGMTQGSAATNAQSVRLAMEAAGIPPGAPVLITGHSQGGIIAANLVADKSFSSTYNVAGVVTYGSPIDCADLGPGSPPILSVQHANSILPPQVGDLVPQLDLGGMGVLGPVTQQGNVSVINLPPRGDSFIDFRANHEQVGYEQDLKTVTPSQQQAIDNFQTQNGLDQFYNGTRTGSVRVPTGTQK